MSPEEIKNRIPLNDIHISTSRSGGPGGQNVNKVSTKVELRFNIRRTKYLTDSEKQLILELLGNRINDHGDLLIVSQSERTQLRNRKKAEEKLFRLLARALTVRPLRKATIPTTASKEVRLGAKKKRGRLKRLRNERDLLTTE